MMALHKWLKQWCALGRPLRCLPRSGALAVLGLFVAAMVMSSFAVPAMQASAQAEREAKAAAAQPGQDGIGDFELYAHIQERVAEGESYYLAATQEQRAHSYPLRPFVTVRLPTLAWAQALLGPQLVAYAGIGMLVVLIAIFLPCVQARTQLRERVAGAIAMLLGGAGVFADQAPFVHELIAGLLVSLALCLYRPHRWWPSLVCAALALFVRELALPFIILWLAFVTVQSRWREAAALVGLLIVFGIALAFHASAVDAHLIASDPVSPGWSAFSGAALPLLALSSLTGLLFLPLWLAAPLALAPLVGWFALGGRLGLFAGLWFAGFFLAMGLFARVENFYWIMMVLPAYAAGLAFAPRAIADLLAAITRPGEGQT